MDNDSLRALAAAADAYFDRAREGLTSSGVGPVRGPIRDVFAALSAYRDARQRIESDADLSPAGRQSRVAQLEATTRAAVLGEVATARRRLEQTRAFHEAKTQLTPQPNVDRLVGRHDVDRLLSGADPARVPELLRFAAQNGTPDVQDVILLDRYPESVLFPSMGPEAAGSAALWAQTRRQLVADRLGEAGAPHLRALEAAATAAKGVTIGEHVVATAFPEEPHGLTPIIVAHGAGPVS